MYNLDMANIDINKLKNIKKELESLNDQEVAFITEDGSEKYAILPISLYETIEEILAIGSDENINGETKVHVVNANSLELSYDEYESVKKQIMDAFDKTFKPKPEKLN